MISCIDKMTDRPVLAALPGVCVIRTGLSSAALLPVRERSERPAQAASAVRAEQAYAVAAAHGAGAKYTQHTSKWAFRGLEPWSDPA